MLVKVVQTGTVKNTRNIQSRIVFRDPTRHNFSGIVPVVWFSKRSVPSVPKNSVRGQNVPNFSTSQKYFGKCVRKYHSGMTHMFE